MTDDADTIHARLREQADRDWAPAWKPERAGDEVAGTITAIRASVQTAYGAVPVVELAELGTQRAVAVWLIHTVLRREFARHKPVPGETVLLRYLGRVEPAGGGPAYESYRLVVDRLDEGSGVDWDAIADPELAGDGAGPDPARDEIPF